VARDRFIPRPQTCLAGVPFACAQDAWFWFIQAHDARAEGARVVAGLSRIPRPCEPADILRLVDRLYRQRRLIRDHLCVLVHYGRRLSAPDPRRRTEARAALLWREAFDSLTPTLLAKGIIQDDSPARPESLAA